MHAQAALSSGRTRSPKRRSLWRMLYKRCCAACRLRRSLKLILTPVASKEKKLGMLSFMSNFALRQSAYEQFCNESHRLKIAISSDENMCS